MPEPEVMNLHQRVQFPRNTTAANNAYIGREGEMTIDLTRKEIRLHDGVKPGGFRIPNITQLFSLYLTLDSEAGGLDFDGDTAGFVVRTGDNQYSLRRFTSDSDLTITHGDGTSDDPKINLPKRLANPSQDDTTGSTEIANLNNIIKSGFYALEATASHLPSDVKDLAASTLIVVAKSETNVTQLICSIQDNMRVYSRSMKNGSWTGWNSLISPAGTYDILDDGDDTTQRTWTAKQINRLIADRLQDIGEEDDTDVKSYSSKRMFKDSIDGYNIPDTVYGPFTPIAGDRQIVYATARASFVSGGVNFEDTFIDGDLKIQLNIGGSWTTVIETPRGAVTQPSPETGTTLRFLFQADKVRLCNSDWVFIDTFAGVWDGRYRIMTGNRTLNVSISGYRLRLKAA